MKKNLLFLMLICTSNFIFSMEPHQERNRIIVLGCLGGAVTYAGIACMKSWFEKKPDLAEVIQGSHQQFNTRFDALHKTVDDLDKELDKQTLECSDIRTQHILNFETLMKMLNTQQDQIKKLQDALNALSQKNKHGSLENHETNENQAEKSTQSRVVIPR